MRQPRAEDTNKRTMSRLPTPGGDQDTWGNVLNDFLSQSHNSDGSLSTNAIKQAGAAILDGTAADIAPSAPSGAAGATGKASDAGHVHPGMSLDIRAYGASTGLADNGPAINAAIAALGAGGGEVIIPPGSWHFTTPLSLAGKASVTLRGPVMPDSGSPTSAQLIYDGTGSASAFDAQNSSGVALRGLQILATSAAHTGILVDLRNVSGSDTAYALLEDCYLQSGGGGSAVVNLDKCIISTLRNCHFGGGAAFNIYGASSAVSYSNAIQIEDCAFNGARTGHIWNPGQAWLITGCTFEQLAGGTAGALGHDAGVNGHGVTVQGCWTGDSSGGTQFTIQGIGFVFAGNYIGASAGTGIAADGTATGTVITGNEFVSCATAVNCGSYMMPFAFVDSNGFTSVTANFRGNFGSGSVVNNGTSLLIFGATFESTVAVIAGQNVSLGEGSNIYTGTATGSIIAEAATQKLGFWGAPPVVQPTAHAETAGYTSGTGTTVTIDGKFTGNTGTTAYTIADVVAALKSAGLIAS